MSVISGSAGSAWNMGDGNSQTVTKDYLEARFMAVDAKLEAIDRSTTLAADTLKERLHNLNEAKAELKEYQSTLTPKMECKTFRESINKELGILHDFKTQMDAKASQQSVLVTGLLAAGGLVVGIVSLFR